MGKIVNLTIIDEDDRKHYFEIEEWQGEYIVYRIEYYTTFIFSGKYKTEIARAKSFDRALEYARLSIGRKIKRIEET